MLAPSLALAGSGTSGRDINPQTAGRLVPHVAVAPDACLLYQQMHPAEQKYRGARLPGAHRRQRLV